MRIECKFITLISSLLVVCLTTACHTVGAGGKDRKSNVEVTHGSPLDERLFPAIIRIRSDRKSIYCSGSVISANAILTAAHCVYDVQNGYQQFSSMVVGDMISKNIFVADGEFGTRYRRYMEHQITLQEFAPYDLAVVVFDNDLATRLGVSDAQILKLAKLDPKQNDWIYLTGWGYTDANNRQSGGALHWGVSRIKSITDHLFTYEGRNEAGPDSNDSSSAHGDSGAPIFLGNSSSLREIIGVVSTVPRSGDGRNTASRVASSVARDLFKFAVNCGQPGKCATNLVPVD